MEWIVPGKPPTLGSLITCPACDNPNALIHPNCIEIPGREWTIRYEYLIDCPDCDKGRP